MKCMVGVKKPSTKKRKLKTKSRFGSGQARIAINWKATIGVVAFCCCSAIIFGQNPSTIIGKSIYELRTESMAQVRMKLPDFSYFSFKPKSLSTPLSSLANVPQYQAPKLYAYQDLAFFCRLEVKMDKASKMPVRFRLGSVDYVNRLEGKY